MPARRARWRTLLAAPGFVDAPFRRILCPVDFSPTSFAALRRAARLAGSLGASLTLLHVYHTPGYALPEGVILPNVNELDRLFSWIDEQLAAWRREARALGADAVVTETAQGAPWQTIVDRAAAGRYDLVVMGTHGHTGLKHVLLGSVTERVVRHASCPVLTVRAPDETARPELPASPR